MNLVIKDTITIKVLQQHFSKEFAYLKLEFFDIPPSTDELFKLHHCANHKTLGACRKLHTEGTILITPNLTVEKLELTLWEKFGLSTKVFRKSGNLWIEPTLTESWTLKRQNDEGQIFSNIKNDLQEDEKSVVQ